MSGLQRFPEEREFKKLKPLPCVGTHEPCHAAEDALLVCAWNCRSASSKLSFISQYFCDTHIDILFLSETWHPEAIPGKLDTFCYVDGLCKSGGA